MTDEQLRALLRLKRFEQPPPGYFDGLLRDIHQRQREDMLRQPLWKIALERLQTFFSEHSMSTPAYAGAMAAVVLTGALTIGILLPRSGGNPGAPVMAAAESSSAVPSSTPTLRLDQPDRVALASERGAQPVHIASHSPRYVIDARPVSYEALNSF